MDEHLLSAVADELIGSYDVDETVVRLPARASVIEAVEATRRLLFPGYYAHEALPAAARRLRWSGRCRMGRSGPRWSAGRTATRAC